MKRLLLIVSIGFLIQACEDAPIEDGVICTAEFRTLGVTVTGGQFDDFYTVRKTDNDTIRHSPTIGGSLGDFYPILDDSYQPKLENDQDTFTFHGFLSGELLVKEDYVIKADECHIELVSGNTEIQL